MCLSGSNVVGDGTVVFRARVGNDVQIGEGATVASPTGERLTLKISEGTLITAYAVVTGEEDLQALNNYASIIGAGFWT